MIDTWHDESGELIDNALSLISNYGSNAYVRKAVQTFFGLPPAVAGKGVGAKPKNPGMFKELQKQFNTISDFFGGHPPDWMKIKPSLYCDSTWAVKEAQGVQATVRDYTGKEIWEGGAPVTVKQAFGKDLRSGLVPFWCSDINAYDFASSKNGEQYCTNNKETKGATSSLNVPYKENLHIAVVTLCPYAFTSMDAIASLPFPSSVAKEDLKDHNGNNLKTGTSLEVVLPKSATLLHEAFHVLNEGVFATTKEVYSVAECLNLKSLDARKNPESYVLFMLAMWYMEKYGWDFIPGAMAFAELRRLE
ncbi:hypothetical protein VMCG_06598 [Cytospora schulzeri]|uniref:Lysine-specific metallo-endopeptidase domain-containing protein n=1 Tax=Cytospora schulzeri TaxID=448051 RepID=A0A423W6Y5_9PEZI|nr:hypothetical protein VMCG_06598 [Valsa malicola]